LGYDLLFLHLIEQCGHVALDFRHAGEQGGALRGRYLRRIAGSDAPGLQGPVDPGLFRRDAQPFPVQPEQAQADFRIVQFEQIGPARCAGGG
jgi:hypothetical protein